MPAISASRARSADFHTSGQDPDAQDRTRVQREEVRLGGFLQFAKAAGARGLIELVLDESADDYVVRVPKS